MKEPPDKEKRPLASKALDSSKSAGRSQKGDGASSKLLVSWVKDATTTKTQDADALRIVESIRADKRGKLRAAIESIRRVYRAELEKTGNREAAKMAVAAAKKRLPGVLWSGRFSSRKRPVSKKLLVHSGRLCADLDKLGERLERVRAKLLTSRSLWTLFLSPSGDGLKAVFRVSADAEKHYASFLAVRAHVEELTQVQIDQSGKDLGRLCFLSYDPDAYSNPDAVELPPLEKEQKPQDQDGGRATNNTTAPEIERRWEIATPLLGEIQRSGDTSGYCICPGRHLHTNGNGPRDCEVLLNGVPSIRCFHDSCRGLVEGANHILRSRIGKAENPTQNVSDSAAWAEPKPLPSDLPAVPQFNFACLPETFRDWIEDIAERMQCPPDFPAVGAMIALGSLVGRKIGIRPKRYDDWLVVPNLWGCIVGRPGLMKTPALEQPLLPLRRLVAEASDRYKEEMQEHEVNSMLTAQGTKLAEKKIAALLNKGEHQAAHDTATAVVKKGTDEPVCRRYETNDPTIEKLGVLLAQNPNGLLLFRDELVGLLRGLDKEGHEGDRAIYLEMWNGTGTFTSDRIQRGTIRTPAIISILGGIQPDLLTAYVREAVRGGQGADGLLQRIRLFVWPDVSKQWHHIDRWPNTEAKNKAFNVFKYLDSLTPDAVGADASSGIPFLRFTHDAQERFDVWRAGLEATLRNDTEHPAFEAHLSKYRKLVPAIALLIHLANRDTGPVSLAALEKALLWAGYLETHARRIYSAVLRPDTAAARELAKHLQRGELPERFTLRETYRKGWAGLSGKDDAEAASEILCDLGWIRPVVEGVRTAGRPASPTFEINPKILNPTTERPARTDTNGSVSSGSEAPGVVEDSSEAKTDEVMML